MCTKNYLHRTCTHAYNTIHTFSTLVSLHGIGDGTLELTAIDEEILVPEVSVMFLVKLIILFVIFYIHVTMSCVYMIFYQ